MSGHRGVYIGWYGAEVFAGDLGSLPMGFETDDGVEFVGAMMHIHTLASRESPGNPVQAVQPHDMVEAQQAGVTEMMAQTLDVVAVTLAPNRFGAKRRKPPVLAFDEESVRRRAPVRFQGEKRALAPNVIAVPVYAEGKIEIKRSAAGPRFFRQRAELFVRQPLNVEMIPLGALVIVVGAQRAAAVRLGPLVPGLALALDFGAKCGVIPRYRMALDEALEAGSAFRRLT